LNTGRFKSPRAIDADEEGNLYVLDGDSVHRFGPGGKDFVCTVSLKDKGIEPAGFAVDDMGAIFALDAGSGLVHKYDW